MNETERNNEHTTGSPGGEVQPLRLSRRFFLKSSSVAVASTGVATIGTVMPNGHAAFAQDATTVGSPDMGTMPGRGTRELPSQVFNSHEQEPVEAVGARLTP